MRNVDQLYRHCSACINGSEALLVLARHPKGSSHFFFLVTKLNRFWGLHNFHPACDLKLWLSYHHSVFLVPAGAVFLQEHHMVASMMFVGSPFLNVLAFHLSLLRLCLLCSALCSLPFCMCSSSIIPPLLSSLTLTSRVSYILCVSLWGILCSLQRQGVYQGIMALAWPPRREACWRSLSWILSMMYRAAIWHLKSLGPPGCSS